MKLLNVHPLPALLSVSAIPGYDAARAGMLVAKATYRVADGVAVLETQEPAPILTKDKPTPLGDLPRDDTLRADPAFEVILLGQAYAAGGKPCPSRSVSLSVGAARRELLITGDRRWEKSMFGQRLSQPKPFTTMPLTWAQAFGGQTAIEIDRESFVDVCDVRNAVGKGFDPEPHAKGMGAKLKSPKPYPRFDPTRVLPNVEHPHLAIREWKDSPDPACWPLNPPSINGRGW